MACDTSFISASAAETEAFAEEFGRRLRGGDVVAFKGGLGAGKTTFTRGLCAGLGIGAFVSSPTYALVHEYAGRDLTLYHFDMYRVLNRGALESTGFFDYLSDGCVSVIEWSENIADALAELPCVITAELERTDRENERKITIRGGRFDAKEVANAAFGA
jgi:tRNA threonylcarbamoyladenosine biosynthesis protein TsaE